MADPPKTGTKSPGTAKVAKPVATATDPAVRMTTFIRNPGTGGAIHTGGSPFREVSPKVKALREKDYFELRARSKFKLVYGTDVYGKMMEKRRALVAPPAGCRPDFRDYVPSDDRLPIHKNAQGDWLCKRKLDDAITFRERKYQNQENDFRVFIEGAEVTPYVEGSISWTTESTGGVNTCRFVLNNTQDAFIITPTNVCAGPYNTSAWRMNSIRKGKSNSLYINTGTYRSSWRVDEVAKWQIYKRKYEAVNPNHEKKQIDSITGMWLYPLNPFSCIFNKHDAVRVFVRLPHVTSQHKPRTKSWYNLWMPAFTGFIDRYSWTDAPVEGKRTVNITCYDYRGLMERMRVRVYSMPASSVGSTGKGGTAAQTAAERGPGKPNSEKNTPSHRNKNYLVKAWQVGAGFEKKLLQIFLSAKSTELYTNVANPYEYGARGFHLEETYIDLHTLWFKKESDSANGGRGCGVGRRAADTGRGRFSEAGKHFDNICAGRIVAKVDSQVSTIAASITKALGHLLESIMVIFDLVGDAYVIKADAVDLRPADGVGKAPGKAKRVIKLRLKDITEIKSIKENIVNSKKAKSQSVEALAGNAIDLIKMKSKNTGSSQSIETLFKEAALIYSAAYFYDVGQSELREHGVEPGERLLAAKNTFAKIVTEQGWGKWVASAAKNGDISATWNPAALAKKNPNQVRSEFYNIIKSYEDRVEKQLVTRTNRILRGRSRLGSAGPLVVGGSTTAMDKNIARTRKNLDKVNTAIFKAGSVGDKKEVARLTAKKTELHKLLVEQSVKRSNPVGSASQTTWQTVLGYQKWPLRDGLASKVGEALKTFGAPTASQLTSLSLGNDAASAMGGYIESAVSEWVISYSILRNRARVLAGILHRAAEHQLVKKNNSDPTSSTYKSFVQAGASSRVGVNIGDALFWINWKRSQLKKSVKGGTSIRALRTTVGLIEAIRAQTAAGQSELKSAKSLADTLLKFAHFETTQAGIFADLVTAVGLQPHPLMGKSLAESIKYLCCEQQQIIPGVVAYVNTYKDGGGVYPGRMEEPTDRKQGSKKVDASGPVHRQGRTILDAWNRTVLFGVIGRPMTGPEVTIVGQGTTTDFRSAFSPFNVFYHLLRPGTGTGAATLLQLNTGTTTINSLNVAYETRKKLLDDICSILDYQYWVSGIGDLIFEMPHYNAMPADFGKVVEQAYTLNKDWTNATIAEEAQDIPTAWVVNGQHIDKKNEPTGGTKLVSNFFKTVVIMAPILARRLGVRVENINLKIPGLGGAGDVHKKKKGVQVSSTQIQQAQDQLNVYACFHIQRQLGRAHTLQVDMPFRPYIVPNRPIWFVPRQRIGLVRSVTHTMNPPMGACSTEMNLGYTRWLFRDGTFRFVAGGPRQPVSYMSFFTGIPPRKSSKEGTLNEDKATLRDNTGTSCTGNLSTVAQQSSAFSAAVATQWGVAYSTPIRLSRPSLSALAAVDLTSGGLRLSAQSSPTAPTSVTLTQATKARGGNALDFMNPVWKAISGENKYKTHYDSFGYLRYWRASGTNVYTDPRVSGDAEIRKKGSKGIDTAHFGWDLPAGVGAPAKTPIDVLSAKIYIRVGHWKSAAGQTVWAKIGRGNTAEKLLYKFRVGDKVQKKNGYIKIYAKPYAIYRSFGGHKAGIDLGRGSNRTGVMLSIEGYTSIPKLQNGGRLYVQLDYIHIADIVRLPTGKKDSEGKDIVAPLGTTGLQGSRKNKTPLVNAGEKICYVGATGCAGAHLHLNMKVKNSAANQADEGQLKLITRANKEFIDTQLRARAAFYNFKGQDPRDDLDKVTKAADYWQSYKAKRALREVRGKTTGTVTVNDVLEYYKSRKTYKQFVPGKGKFGAGGWVYVYAALFYTYEQILFTGKERSRQWQGRAKRYQNFRHILDKSKPSPKYQQSYTMLCQTAAARGVERLSMEYRKCENKHSILSPIAAGAVLSGKPYDKVMRLQQACKAKVDKRKDALHGALGTFQLAPYGSRDFINANKVTTINAKNSAALRDRKLKALLKARERSIAGNLGGSLTGDFVRTR